MTYHNKYLIPKVLTSGSLADDKRIVEAKRLLRAAVVDHTKHLTHVQPPVAILEPAYQSMLADFAHYRGSPLWYPYIGSGVGKGALVELADGSVKYDFICGIGSHYFGHNNLDIIDALVDAAVSNTVMQGNLQQNVDSLELSALLTKESGLPHCFLSTSGAMANENAFKIAFQKNFPANRILAFDHCFAGRSLATSQITDKPAYREGLPLNIFVDYIPFFDPSYPRESTERAVAALNTLIARYPKAHACMCFEFVQGEGGFHHGSREFYKTLMEILKKHSIAIFADEVQSFARTPALFAYQYFDLQPYVDIASIGKISQVCVTLFTDAYNPKPGLLSQTFTGSTSAIKSSLVIVRRLLEDGFFGDDGKIQHIHRHFTSKLEQLSTRHPDLIQGPFGLGCMIAFTAYGGDAQKTHQFLHRLFHAGVIGFIAGAHPTRVRFLVPAGAITFDDIDRAVVIIEQTLIQNT